jgi:hypothetical protein
MRIDCIMKYFEVDADKNIDLDEYGYEDNMGNLK